MFANLPPKNTKQTIHHPLELEPNRQPQPQPQPQAQKKSTNVFPKIN